MKLHKELSILVLIIVLFSIQIGCAKEPTSETSSNTSNNESSTSMESLEKSIDGFEFAEYEKFNSVESVEKYASTQVYFEGTVKLLYQDGEKIMDANEGSFQYFEGKTELLLSITQENGKEWFVYFGNFDREPFTSKAKLDSLSGKKVRFFGIFCGYNTIYKKPLVKLYVDAKTCGKCRIELIDDNKQYTFTDFRNDSETMVAWCDKNSTILFAEDIKNPDYVRNAYKTSGIIKSMQRSKNLVSLYTKKKDGSLCVWDIDTTKHLGFVDGADLENFVVGDSITLYYGVSVSNEPYFFSATRAKDVDFTMDDVNKQFQTDTSSPETNESTEAFTSETEGENTFDGVIYEDSSITIKFLKVDSKGVHFDVENLTDKNITIQADSVSINGRSYNDIIMSDDIAPCSIGEVVARCSIDNYKSPVKTVGGQLRVFDFESLDSYNVLLDNVVINDKVEIEQPQPTGILVFENKKARIYYKEITSRGIVFEVENLTGVNLTIQADSLSINKRSINDIIMSDEIAPHSLGEVIAICSPEYDGEVSTISGHLRIIDFVKLDSTNAKFVDVNLDKGESNDT